jgi:putative hemolysin
MEKTLPDKAFPFSGALRPLLDFFSRITRKMFEALTGIRRIKAICQSMESGLEDSAAPLDFIEKGMNLLGVEIPDASPFLPGIPGVGPLIVVSNHPFGGIDGLILTALLLKKRPDVRVMANSMLGAVPGMKNLFFFVDPFGRADSSANSMGGIKKALRWVKDGGALIVFPAGEVSHFHLKTMKVKDGPWSAQIGRIAQMTGAKVLPFYFSGRNSWLFQAAGLLHPILRTLLLPRELLNKKGTPISLAMGMPISHKKLLEFESQKELTKYLRLRTYNLSHCRSSNQSPCGSDKGGGLDLGFWESDSNRRKNAAEVEALDRKQILLENNRFLVCVAEARQIPNLLQTIGRYREVVFRSVGEGTGNSLDLDVFDNYYRHLILWSKENQEPAGAYRIGETDRILARFGVRGLYTNTLFSINPALFSAVGPSLELGRSFIYTPYQRHFTPLLMLWQGIGAFMAQNPEYACLFGPVSISGEYADVSKRYLVEFLKKNCFAPDLACFVKPKTPPRFNPLAHRHIRHTMGSIRSIDDLNALIQDIEPGRRDIPVLLRHYLKVGGNILGFNVDYAFGKSLDGLILVDVARAPLRTLARFMGEENALNYLEYHGKSCKAHGLSQISPPDFKRAV